MARMTRQQAKQQTLLRKEIRKAKYTPAPTTVVGAITRGGIR